MRLSVSNLAWPNVDNGPFLELLAGLGATAVEVAPTRLAPWQDMVPTLLRSFRAECAAAGLVVSSIQSILYGLPELQLIGERARFDRLHEHIRVVCGLGAELGGRVVVFGAPGNRRLGSMLLEDAEALAVERMGILGITAEAAGMMIAIEPVPKEYGCDFLMRAKDVERLVRRISHRAVGAHLDSACALLAGDDIALAVAEMSSWLAHFHAAEPNLGDFEVPKADHVSAGRALEDHAYQGFVAIEMREAADPRAAITRAVQIVKRHYGAGERLRVTVQM